MTHLQPRRSTGQAPPSYSGASNSGSALRPRSFTSHCTTAWSENSNCLKLGCTAAHTTQRPRRLTLKCPSSTVSPFVQVTRKGVRAHGVELGLKRLGQRSHLRRVGTAFNVGFQGGHGYVHYFRRVKPPSMGWAMPNNAIRGNATAN